MYIYFIDVMIVYYIFTYIFKYCIFDVENNSSLLVNLLYQSIFKTHLFVMFCTSIFIKSIQMLQGGLDTTCTCINVSVCTCTVRVEVPSSIIANDILFDVVYLIVVSAVMYLFQLN